MRSFEGSLATAEERSTKHCTAFLFTWTKKDVLKEDSDWETEKRAVQLGQHTQEKPLSARTL